MFLDGGCGAWVVLIWQRASPFGYPNSLGPCFSWNRFSSGIRFPNAASHCAAHDSTCRSRRWTGGPTTCCRRASSGTSCSPPQPASWTTRRPAESTPVARSWATSIRASLCNKYVVASEASEVRCEGLCLFQCGVALLQKGGARVPVGVSLTLGCAV